MILNKTDLPIGEHFSLNQWKNTRNVLDCFKEMPVKKLHKLVLFDTEFFPSIKEDFVPKDSDFVKTYVHGIKRR